MIYSNKMLKHFDDFENQIFTLCDNLFEKNEIEIMIKKEHAVVNML
jgi:hypothetical protein